MTTLEYMIKLELDKAGYMSSSQYLKCIAEYIETYNQHAENNGDEFLTPCKWLRHTVLNSPNELTLKREFYKNICGELLEQVKNCIEQTGRTPTIEDFQLSLESDYMKDKMGDFIIDVADLLMFLMNYYMDKEI
jgi:hypothetical protein